jgi:hypothetical protein
MFDLIGFIDILNSNETQLQISNDIPNKVSFIDINNGLTIYDNFISENQYINEEVKKETIWLHNTGGGSRPDWTVNGMKNDIVKDKEGSSVLDENGNIQLYQVSSCYIIGRKSSSTNEMNVALLKSRR